MTAPALEQGRPAVSTGTLHALQRLRTDVTRWAPALYRIRDKHGQLRPFTLNRVQLAIAADERRQLRTLGQCRQFILKARQGGVSTFEQATALHQVWGTPNFDAMTLAHTKDDTDTLFEITRRAVQHFPEGLLPRLGASETREISFPSLDTHFFTGTAGAKRTGRGKTLKRMHGSEAAFWDDLEGTLTAVGPALVPVGSVVALETTASGFGSPPHDFWREAKARGYEPLFYPWWECDVENYRLPLLAPDELGKLEEEEQLLVDRHGLSLEQIKWRRFKIAEYGRGDFLTEYAEDAESCWAAVGGMFYDAELLKALLIRAPELLSTDLGGALRIYAEIPGEAPGGRRGVGPRTERVIIGADTAEGVGGDRSTMVARAFPSWRQLVKYEDSQVTPRDFAGILNTWGRRLGGASGPALLVVEKNMHGITTLRHRRDDHAYPTEYIYHRASLDQEHEGAELDSGRIGWHTSAESQPLMLDAGRELLLAARDGYASVPSASCLRDAFKVRRDKNGRIKLTGCDVLVAETLAWLGRSYPVYEPMIGRA